MDLADREIADCSEVTRRVATQAPKPKPKPKTRKRGGIDDLAGLPEYDSGRQESKQSRSSQKSRRQAAKMRKSTGNSVEPSLGGVCSPRG